MNRYTSLAVALGLFGAVAVARTLRGAADADPMHRLEHAGAGRAFAPRLSIPTKYRRCTPLRARGDGIVPRAACGEAEDAALDANAFPSIVESTDPDSLEAAALAKVIWGDGSEEVLGDAISRLEKAIRLTDRPVPVRLLVDLSAAHLVRAEQTQNSSDLVRGLDNALQALEREPKNEAALFDAALALESLALDGEAAKAWNRYLAVDSTSVWAREARQRRDGLKPPPPLRKPRPNASTAEVEAFAAQHPQEARLLGWDHELGDWGAAVLRGDTAAAASHLDLAERLGNALVRHRGDASLAEAAHAIHAASSNPTATRSLARAHRAYAVAQELFRTKDFEPAKDSLRWVANSHAVSPVLLDWAVVSLAGAGVYLKPGEGDAVIRALVARVDSVRYPAMAARLRWMWGTKVTRGAHYQEARGQYEAAAHLYERLGETEFEGAVLAFAGEAAYKHGDAPIAYSETHRALVKLRHYRSSVWLHNPLMTLATSATLEGMERAATPIQDEDVVVALRNDVPEIPLEALLGRVRIRAMAGDSVAARRDLGDAVALFRRIKPGGRDWLNAELQFTRALVTPRADSGSVAGLDSAIDSFKTLSVAWLLAAFMRRADVRVASGNLPGAMADLDSATVRIRGLSNQDQPFMRTAMIEEAKSRFDQLVMLHVRAGRSTEALRVLERGRVSFAPSSGAEAPTDRQELVAPPGQVAVEYALIGDTLLTWTVRGRDVDLRGVVVDRDEFIHTVEQVGAGLESPTRAETMRPQLDRLYRWLVRPVEDRLGPAETPLVILADGEVSGVPFEALYDARRGKYLLEGHSLRFASSLADARRPAPARTSPESALLVADPAFDSIYNPSLDPLRGARAEVSALERLYPTHDLLVDSDATRAEFMRRAQRASVIHYAGHAVFDDARPERSYLVLVGDSTSGQLTADSISVLKLGGVRLVVLSACQTLRTREGRSGGFAGLSGALLAAGAGGVVGSMWDVDDTLAQPLMVAFHREYLSTHDPARALRIAQLQQLRRRRSPAGWAGFRYAGR